VKKSIKKIKVNLKNKSYDILIGSGALSKLKGELKKLKLGKVAAVITNPKINRLHGPALKKALKDSGLEVHFIQVPDTEKSKSSTECINVVKQLANLDKGKDLFIIAFGGGVVGDLAGFCASVYRRGIPYIQIPTTLLAQVDSSIGGKVAIDLPSGKNLIGSFYQPRLVLADTKLLNSLSAPQIKEALAEIIKYGVIADSKLFSFLEKHIDEILKLKPKSLQYIIEKCAQIKARVIEKDEYDKKDLRIMLNFGHTAGHAIEAASGYKVNYSHGYAIALGMLVASSIAKQLKITSSKTIQRIECLIKKAGLPTAISGLKLNNILKAQEHDKKFRAGKNRFVLPVAIGRVKVKENIPETIISKAIKSRMP